jgi:hypothetical protein
MFHLPSWPQIFRFLTLGGLIGGTLGAVVYFCFASHFVEINFWGFVGICVAFGTILQRAIGIVVQPVINFIRFREELFELGIMRDRGEIDQRTYQKVVNGLVERRFLKG